MITRRTIFTGLGGLVVVGGVGVYRRITPSCRPALSARGFTSPAVEECIKAMRKRIGDPVLAQLFENCFPNTLDTTVTLSQCDGAPDTFIIAGDIHAMWLRDSSEQVRPYLGLARRDEALRTMFRGLISRQARSLLIDSYANAFMQDTHAHTTLSWAKHDMTSMKPGVAERKWELDSLCHVIRLSHDYWRATGDVTPFDVKWRAAMSLAVATMRTQQRLSTDGPYHFQRVSESPLDTLPLDGFGAPARKVGLIHSGFRPSDDACIYPFHIPDNLFAVVALRLLAAMAKATGLAPEVATDSLALADEVSRAAAVYGNVRWADGSIIRAYEVDGFGNAIFMDDANIPGLLSLPLLGVCGADDPLYLATRRKVLSDANPYFAKGLVAEGVGGPHIGVPMIWPMSIMVRAMTSTDDAEIRACLDALKRSTAGTGLMHEAFHKDNARNFTRRWFAWANSLFGMLILDLARRKPYLLN
jgi:uncharacterized protein